MTNNFALYLDNITHYTSQNSKKLRKMYYSHYLFKFMHSLAALCNLRAPMCCHFPSVAGTKYLLVHEVLILCNIHMERDRNDFVVSLQCCVKCMAMC